VGSFIVGPGEGHRLGIGPRVLFEDPDGAYAVLEGSPPPGTPAPYDHIHRSYDEAWYVVEGAYEFRVGDRVRRAAAGSLVFAERGTPHTYRNVGDAPASILQIVAPVACLRMLEELGEIAVPGQNLDADAMAAIFARHDTEVVPPLG
jgi:quercetin dioxygenase-like cupin family protein